MKTVVINLDQATERMSFQEQQLNRLGINFIRLSANCDSHSQSFETYKDTWERPLSFSEVSLFFNHKKIWEICLKENIPILILEDDACLADNIVEVLNYLSNIKEFDYVNLEARGPSQRKLIATKADSQFPNLNLYRLYQGRSGTGGYVLWPSGAKKLIARFHRGKIGIVDKFINSTYSLIAYQAEPAPLIQMDMCSEYNILPPLETVSSIDSSNRSSEALQQNFRFKCLRVQGQIKIALNHFRHIFHAHKRSVKCSNYINPR